MFLELLDSYNDTLVCFIMRKQGVASLLLGIALIYLNLFQLISAPVWIINFAIQSTICGIN